MQVRPERLFVAARAADDVAAADDGALSLVRFRRNMLFSFYTFLLLCTISVSICYATSPSDCRLRLYINFQNVSKSRLKRRTSQCSIKKPCRPPQPLCPYATCDHLVNTGYGPNGGWKWPPLPPPPPLPAPSQILSATQSFQTHVARLQHTKSENLSFNRLNEVSGNNFEGSLFDQNINNNRVVCIFHKSTRFVCSCISASELCTLLIVNSPNTPRSNA